MSQTTLSANDSDISASSEPTAIANDAERLLMRFRHYTAIFCQDLEVSPISDTEGRAKYEQIVKTIFSTIAIGSLFLNASILYSNESTFSTTAFRYFVSGLHAVALGCIFFLLFTTRSTQRKQLVASCCRLKDLSSQFLELLKVRQNWNLKLRTVQFEFAKKCDEVSQIAARITTEAESLRLAEENRLACEAQLEGLHLAYDETAAQLKSLNADVTEKLSLLSEYENMLANFEQANTNFANDQKLSIAELERTRILLNENTENLSRIEALVAAAHIDLELTQSLNTNKKIDLESLEELTKQLLFESESVKIAINDAEHQLATHSMAVRDKQLEISELNHQLTDAKNSHAEQLSRSVALEASVTQQKDLIAEGEAHLASLRIQTLEDGHRLKNILEEQAEVEQKSAVILSRLGELERLSFTKLAIEAESERMQCEIECQQALLTELASEESQVRDRIDLLKAITSSTLVEHDNLTEQLELLAYRIANSVSVLTRRESQILANEARQYDLELTIAECVRRVDEESARVVEYAALVEQSKQAAIDADKATADAERRTMMLSEKADALTARVEEKASQLYALKQEFINVRSDLRDLELAKQEYAELEHRLHEIDVSLAEKTLAQEMLLRELAISESLLSLKTASISSLELEIEAIELRVLAAQKLSISEEHERSLLHRNREELTTEIESLNCLLDEFRSDINEHQSVLRDLETAMAEARLELQELETTKADQNKEIETMSEVASLLRNQTQSLELELVELEIVRASRVEIETQIETASVRLADLLHDQQSAQLVVDARVRDADEAQARVLKLQKTIESLEKESSESSLRLSLLSEDVIDAEKVSRQWSEYLESLNGEILKQEGTKDNLNLAIDHLVEQEQKHRRASEESEVHAQSAENRLQALGGKCEAATVLLQKIQNETEETTTRLTELRVQEQEVNENLNRLFQQVENSETEIRDLHSQIEVSLDRCCKQAQETLHWDARIEALSAEVDRRERELDSLKHRCAELAIQSTCDENAAEAKRLEILELEKDVVTLESLKLVCDEQRAALEGILLESDRLTAHIQHLEQAIIPLEVKRDELGRLCAESEAQKTHLDLLCEKSEDRNRQLAKLEASIAEKYAEQACIQSQIAEDGLKLIELGNAQSAAMEQIREQAQQSELAQADLNEKREQNETAEVQLQQSISQLADIEQSFAATQIQLREAHLEKQAIAEDIEQLQLGLAQLQKEQESAEERSMELDGEIQRKAAESNAIQGDISMAIAKVSQLTELSVTLAEATSVISSKLEEVENLYFENNADLSRLQINRDQLANTCDEMRLEIALLEDKVTALRVEVAEMSQTKESVQQTLDALTQTSLLAEPMQVANAEQADYVESAELKIWKTVLDLAEIGKSSQPHTVDELGANESFSETIQNESPRSTQLDPWDSVLSIN